MKKRNSLIIVAVVFVLLFGTGLFLLPETSLAADAGSLVKEGLSKAGTAAYGSDAATPLPVVIGNIISALLGAVGLVFLILTVYAGIMYMTAAGDDTKVKKAKQILTNSLIGLIIIVAAYAISKFVIDAIATVTAGGGKN